MNLPNIDLFERGEGLKKILPERAQRAFQAQENQAEHLIGWIQLGLVSTLAFLDFLAPEDTIPFEPIPWAVGSYLVFTLVRLIWSYRVCSCGGRLPAWLLVVSALFDILLLMSLIWSLHLQYMQPAIFYLKAPLLLYVFIFIAIRALHLRVRYVLITGVFAFLGWAFMICYAIVLNPKDPGITHHYVEHMASNTLLLRAEFDKLLCILLVTVILGLSVHRAHRLLTNSLSEGPPTHPPSRFSPFAPPTHNAETRPSRQAERRELAILNLDIRGFNRLAARESPEKVMSLLSEYRALCVPVIQKNNGLINAFMGDRIVAIFGASPPRAGHAVDSYAADALRALDQIMALTDDWARGLSGSDKESRPRVNGAATVGTVLLGLPPEGPAPGKIKESEGPAPGELEYSLIGDAVNLSAGLEKHNKAMDSRALCDQASYEKAVDQGYNPKLPKDFHKNAAIKGLQAPLDIVILAR